VTAAKMVASRPGSAQALSGLSRVRAVTLGRPIVAFTRISDDPIQNLLGRRAPQIVAVLDPRCSDRRRHQGRARRRRSCWSTAICRRPSSAKAKMKGRRSTRWRPPGSPSRPSAAPYPTRPWSAPSCASPGCSTRERVEFLRAEFGKKFPPKVSRATCRLDARLSGGPGRNDRSQEERRQKEAAAAKSAKARPARRPSRRASVAGTSKASTTGREPARARRHRFPTPGKLRSDNEDRRLAH